MLKSLQRHDLRSQLGRSSPTLALGVDSSKVFQDQLG
jgi:hypothetical protein